MPLDEPSAARRAPLSIFGDAPMQAGPSRVEFAGLPKIGELLARSRQIASFQIRPGLLWVAAVLMVGSGAWVLSPVSDGHIAQSDPPRSEQAIQIEPLEPVAAPRAMLLTQVQTPEAAELDRLRISSQTWRRGGLGSIALITFTLRNDNDYAVKDVEIFCSFSRHDGTHLTDRRRLLPEIVNMKSRKTFARVHVGFVNVNADQAKCSLAAARRA